MSELQKWLRDGLKEKGRGSINELAEALGKHRSSVDKLLVGKRPFYAEEIPAISKFIGRPAPMGEMTYSGGDSDRVRELEAEVAQLKALLADYLIKEKLAQR